MLGSRGEKMSISRQADINDIFFFFLLNTVCTCTVNIYTYAGEVENFKPQGTRDGDYNFFSLDCTLNAWIKFQTLPQYVLRRYIQ